MTKLNPWWVTGYTDAEGCFLLNIFKNKNVARGYSAKLIYQITAHHSDHDIMHALKAFFNNVGHIEYTSDNKYVSYRVYTNKDIVQTILPHFESYPLHSEKYIYFVLWSKSAHLMFEKLHLTDRGFIELLTYKASFTKKLDAEIFNNKFYSDIVPFNVNNIMKNSNVTLDPNYIAGFTGADGSFSITKPSLVGRWPNYDANFRIHQNIRDKELLKSMRDQLGCGKVHILKDGMCNLSVRNKCELTDIIIPFFDKYQLNVQKKLDFLQFKKALLILRKNLGKGLSNLSLEDRQILDLCISKMNRNRYSCKNEKKRDYADGSAFWLQILNMRFDSSISLKNKRYKGHGIYMNEVYIFRA